MRRRVLPAVCEVEVEEGAELDGVALAGPEREVDGGVILGCVLHGDRARARGGGAGLCEQAEGEEGRVGGVHSETGMGRRTQEDGQPGRALYRARKDRAKFNIYCLT